MISDERLTDEQVQDIAALSDTDDWRLSMSTRMVKRMAHELIAARARIAELEKRPAITVKLSDDGKTISMDFEQSNARPKCPCCGGSNLYGHAFTTNVFGCLDCDISFEWKPEDND